jgi:signal transduction histidine kinase
MEHETRSARPAAGSGARARTESDEEVVDIGIGDDILAVDDTPANLIAIQAALAPLGRHVVTVGSGVAALARLLEQDFALIVLDVAMPGMTGIETARLIRARERNRGTPIIFVTAMEWHDEAIDEAYEAGGFDFLTKPIRPELLRARVSVFLKLQERTRALRRRDDQLRQSQALLYEHELIEQRKRFESELLDSKLAQLSEGDRRQHELAQLIGNELINPLHTLRVAFDLLREHPKADRGERIYTLIEHWLDHVTQLVEGLIDVARLAAGQLALHREPVHLAELVRQALDDRAAVIASRRLVVRFDTDPAAALIVLGDPVRLLQALAIVVEHAVRSAAEGGDLVVRAAIAHGDVVIRVRYTGRGFGAAVLRRLFEMCASDDDDAAQAGRLRLGFALARRLIELHDGSIRASSAGVNLGASFEIRLPQPPQDVELASLDYPEPGALPTARMPALERPVDDAV